MSEKKRIFAANGIQNTGFYHTMSLIKGKYKLPVLYCLYLNGPTRYNELKRLMETATFRSLTSTLKGLEEDGLVIRKEYDQIPPKVEYSLSKLGQSLTPVMESFCQWGEEHRDGKLPTNILEKAMKVKMSEKLGQSLTPVMESFCQWGEEHRDGKLPTNILEKAMKVKMSEKLLLESVNL